MRLSIILSLVKVNLKETFSLSVLKSYYKKKDYRFWTSLGILLLAIVSIAPLVVMYYLFLNSAYDQLAILGQTEVIIVMGALLSAVLVLFLGMAYLIATFYFAKDIETLAALPLKPLEIMSSKFLTVLISEYLTITPFYLPALFIYGFRSGANLSFWLIGLISFFLLPLIPLTIAAVGTLLIMSLTNLGRKKDLLRVLGMVLLIVVILGLNTLLMRLPEGQEQDYLITLLEEESGLIELAGQTYPPSIWLTKAVAHQNFKMLALLVAVSGGGLVLMLLAGNLLFWRGLIGGSEVAKGKAVTFAELPELFSKARSNYLSLALKEIKLLIRTPIYMFNSIAIVILIPLLMLVPFLTRGTMGLDIELLILGLDLELIIIGGAIFIAMMAIFAPALSSSISREGKLFKQAKLFPMSPIDQLLAKLLSGVIIMVLTIPVYIFLMVMLLSTTLFQMFLIIFFGLIFSMPVLILSLLADLIRPYFTWQNPQQAIKQNLNVLLGMVLSAAFLLGLGFLGFRLYVWGWNAVLLYLSLTIICVLISAASFLVLRKLAPIKYEGIEM